MHFKSLRVCLFMLLVLSFSIAKGAIAVEYKVGQQIEKQLDIVGEGKSTTLHYLLYVPDSYGQGNEAWPLMLFLHGLGECGTKNLDLVKVHGPPKLVDKDSDFPFIVVSPQCEPKEFKDVPTAWDPEQLAKLLDHVSLGLNVDQKRTYATGLSMGGFGVWRLIAAYPDRFAAAVSICGGGDVATAEKIKLPVWCFHGKKDSVVPLKHSEEMVEAVESSGGNARLTVYPDANHDSWTETYNNPEVFKWLLSHKKGS